jgi:lysophospholipase L1-like esterase
MEVVVASVKAAPPAARGKRLLFRVAKWLFALGFTLAALAALAYKRVIPGGDWMVENGEELRTRWRSYSYSLEADSVPAGTVVFLGSSSVAAFPFAAYFPGAPWLNRGLPTETAEQLADRVGETMPTARPSGVVIWTGMNDLRSEAQPPEVVAERVTRVVDLVGARFPGVPIAVLEILPQCDCSPVSLERLHHLNKILEDGVKARGATFVKTIRQPLVTEEGRLAPGAARLDRKHVNFVGYSLLARWILEDGGPATAALTPR